MVKTISQLRLECLRLAANLASAKLIRHADVIPTAMEFYRWVDSGDEGEIDIGALYAKFGKTRERQ